MSGWTGVWHTAVLTALIWSAVTPADTLTWWLDIAPVLLMYGTVTVTRRDMPLTPLSEWLVALLLIIIAIGAHYGFAAVPGFDALPPHAAGRNSFDRYAHFFQGFVPAAVFREILIRTAIAPNSRWLVGLTLALTLALSALYELVEWSAALALGERADSFIASQGDHWDTQTDMALALAGAATLLLTLSRFQDQQIAALRQQLTIGLQRR